MTTLTRDTQHSECILRIQLPNVTEPIFLNTQTNEYTHIQPNNTDVLKAAYSKEEWLQLIWNKKTGYFHFCSNKFTNSKPTSSATVYTFVTKKAKLFEMFQNCNSLRLTTPTKKFEFKLDLSLKSLSEKKERKNNKIGERPFSDIGSPTENIEFSEYFVKSNRRSASFSTKTDLLKENNSSSTLKEQTNAGITRKKTLPKDLQDEICKFRFEGFAKKHFMKHKKGVFRRTVPVKELITWSSTPIAKPLMLEDYGHHKNCLRCFKLIQLIMGDRENKKKLGKIQMIRELLDLCIKHSVIRDEAYAQLCKQMINNPKPKSEKRGWELLSIFLNYFPPSKNFESYLNPFIEEKSKKNQVYRLPEYCLRELKKIVYQGYKGKPTSDNEIIRSMELPFLNTVFGDSLDNIMRDQEKTDPDLEIPKIIIFLTEAIIEFDGLSSEGIFRLSGEASEISELRYRIERDIYSTENISDCNVYASVLKAWFRELDPPLIPFEYYQNCINNHDNIEELTLTLSKFPEINKNVLLYIVNYLKQFANEKNFKRTKMNMTNLATVFAPNVMKNPQNEIEDILNDSKNEQQLFYILLKTPLNLNDL